jgi:UDP-N-acetylglucosamine--N-acetylmuramyl-(pentapeptide) pyrophosphoryl-undecaprenol N-acetylglucosamine transferase
MTKTPCALVMAGGTGGHIFPGLAVAQALQQRGWRVHWLGAPQSMESKLVPQRGIAMEWVEFSGVRGKGIKSWLQLPWRLLRAMWQSFRIMQRLQPNVVIGLGGYITMPGGLVAALSGKPVLLHEQNSVAGMANKLLARCARRVFTAFPSVLPQGQWIGNPLRSEFLQVPQPTERFAGRSGPLRIVVVGGSLGAKALNEVVPQALAQIPLERRPQVLHQSGEKQLDALRSHYQAAGVHAECVAFIENTAQAFADADLVICRAGASTVTEIAAVGAAAYFVPFPFAVDDHQTHNARFLVDQGGGWLLPQSQCNPQAIAQHILQLSRETLLHHACNARRMQQLQATEQMVAACEEWL